MNALESFANAGIGLLVSWAATHFILGYTLDFQHAATSGVGPLSLKAQTVFLNQARRRAGVAG